jgi:hypothetical protein
MKSFSIYLCALLLVVSLGIAAAAADRVPPTKGEMTPNLGIAEGKADVPHGTGKVILDAWCIGQEPPDTWLGNAGYTGVAGAQRLGDAPGPQNCTAVGFNQYWCDASWPDEFLVHFWLDENADGIPDGNGGGGAYWTSPFPIVAPVCYEYVWYDIGDVWGVADVYIPSGTFYLGFSIPTYGYIYSGWDYDATPADWAWWWNTTEWGNIQSQGYSGAWTQCADLSPAVAQNVGVKRIDEPGPMVGESFTPVVTIANAGTEPTAEDVYVTVTITPGGYDVTRGPYNLDVNEELTITDFTPFSTAPCGKYTIQACVSMVGDEAPADDCKSTTTMVCDYMNDFEDAGCFIPFGSWGWGDIAGGPGKGHSGTKAWATNPTGNYNPNACDSLIADFIAVGDDPMLIWWDWRYIESYYDGYAVYMSVNGGPRSLVTPTPGYSQTYCYASCWICGSSIYNGTGDWRTVKLDLTGINEGDEISLAFIFASDASVQYWGAALDDFCGNCLILAPPKVDVDIDDDYANLTANTMTLYAPESRCGFVSVALGSFVVVNPDQTNNVDYWDGPGKVDFDELNFESTDLSNFYKCDKPIKGSDVTFSAIDGLDLGQAKLVVLGVMMPHDIENGEGDKESKVYRGTVKATAKAMGACGEGEDFDEFTLKVKGVDSWTWHHKHHHHGCMMGEWGDEGVTFSWGEIDFAESFNIYRDDGTGNFVKLNDSPLSDNTDFTDSDVTESRAYEYKFGMVLPNGEEVTFGPMTAVHTRGPVVASLMPNVPNPMTAETEIRYNIASDAPVTLAVYDITGAVVKTLVSESMKAGQYSVTWNATDEAGRRVANGVYFYRLSAGDFAQSRKLVVMR